MYSLCEGSGHDVERLREFYRNSKHCFINEHSFPFFFNFQDPRPKNRISMDDSRRFYFGDASMNSSYSEILSYGLLFGQ